MNWPRILRHPRVACLFVVPEMGDVLIDRSCVVDRDIKCTDSAVVTMLARELAAAMHFDTNRAFPETEL